MQNIDRRRVIGAFGGGASSALLPASIRAQTTQPAWPVGTIKFMAPVPAGGGVDVFCRRLADRMAAHLKINVIVENKTGAAGLVGAQALASSPPDGANFGYLHSGHVTMQAMGAKLDLVNDFVPVIGRYSASQFVIAVHADAPYQTIGDLTKFMLANPGRLNYGSGGHGTPGHMTFEMLRARMPGLDAVHVPFKGAIDAVNAVASKNLDFVSGLLAAVLVQVRAGRVRALAVSGEFRSPQMPSVPTIAESGLPGFNYVSSAGVFAPARTPAPLVATLRSVLQRIAVEPDFIAFVTSTGAQMVPDESPGRFAAYLKSALATEYTLMNTLGLKMP